LIAATAANVKTVELGRRIQVVCEIIQPAMNDEDGSGDEISAVS
jgi:hypothetical protein